MILAGCRVAILGLLSVEIPSIFDLSGTSFPSQPVASAEKPFETPNIQGTKTPSDRRATTEIAEVAFTCYSHEEVFI